MSLVILPKVSLPKLSCLDIEVISDACTLYARDLQTLKDHQNTAQQNIHFSILQLFRLDLVKRMTKREQPKESKLNMEISTAFVVYDALQHYSNHCNGYRDQAILRRLIIDLFAELPNTSDKNLSIHSNLNFNSNA